MPAPDRVLRTIDRFDQFVDDYKSGPYNETTVLEFIDPFFAAMGWDVHNEKGYARPTARSSTNTVKIDSDVKAPDYSFRIGGVRKFFLEAKKPSVDIKHDIHPLSRCAAIVERQAPAQHLDFEEFAVYDCRSKTGG